MAAKKKTIVQQEGATFAASVPPLASYLRRIGAEELSFRRFMVKDYRGGNNYYVERTIIKINPDNTITSNREEHAPTNEEAEAIKNALSLVTMPSNVTVSFKSAEAHVATLRGEGYIFVTHSRGDVTMVRERIEKDDGDKQFIPWTYWSDGQWRRMEPDGLLPFWKPHTDRKRPRKLIHEGEKAAKFIDALVNNPELEDALFNHPWGEELKNYEHWGLIGGALAPQRTNYSELKAATPLEVIYASDKDYAGESALQEVAAHYGESMLGIFFGDKFPGSWDMADPMPKILYTGKRYNGPMLRDLVFPATRATEMVANPSGKGRKIPILKRAFKEEWLHCIRPEVFVHREWPHEMWTMAEFNNKVRPFSDVDDTARMLKIDAASKSGVLKYDPSTPAGVYTTGDEGRYINTHRPCAILEEEGSEKPWTDFMNHLIPDEGDRLELVRWCATLIARPEVRMNYGVLLISEMQGVGKGTLGEKILAPLVGETNVSYPSEQEIVDSNFNYWLAHKRLAVVHEIYSGHSTKAYNRLKSIITDRYVTVSKKYMANYEIECWLHLLACSNSFRAIQMTMDDRRWLVPRVTEERMPNEYWSNLNAWLREKGGLGIIKRWARSWLEENDGVLRGAVAPWTKLKKEVVEEGYSPGQTLVAKTLDRVTSVLRSTDEMDEDQVKAWRGDGMVVNGHSVVLLDTDLVRLISDVVHQGRQSDRLERPLTVRKIAKSMGWHVGKIKVSTGMRAWGPSAHNGRIISNDPKLADANPTELGGAKGEGNPLRIKPLKLDWAKEV